MATSVLMGSFVLRTRLLRKTLPIGRTAVIRLLDGIAGDAGAA